MSCGLLPLYSNMSLLACTVVADHLRFHVVGTRMRVEAYLVASLHLWFYQSAASFRDRHVAWTSFKQGHHGGSRVYSLWILVCVVASVRGAGKNQALNGRT
eukprot:5234675-Amphidinium_carterae.1